MEDIDYHVTVANGGQSVRDSDYGGTGEHRVLAEHLLDQPVSLQSRPNDCGKQQTTAHGCGAQQTTAHGCGTQRTEAKLKALKTLLKALETLLFFLSTTCTDVKVEIKYA